MPITKWEIVYTQPNSKGVEVRRTAYVWAPNANAAEDKAVASRICCYADIDQVRAT